MKKLYLITVLSMLFLAGCNPRNTIEPDIIETSVNETIDNEATEYQTTINQTTEYSGETTEKLTEEITEAPTEAPTEVPTEAPTEVPTEAPTPVPTQAPTEAPTERPTPAPTEASTEAPTPAPTEAPTPAPTQAPTEPPTEAPTPAPTEPPTEAPTQPPTETQTDRVVVDYVTEESSVASDYKYGIKKIEIIFTNYYVYSDGSKEFASTDTKYKYDYSGYKAEDTELFDECKALTIANMEYYNEILALVNQLRAEVGVAPLTLDITLCEAATLRSLEMNYACHFSHTRPNGERCFSVLDSFNYSWGTVGENIARGYYTPEAVVEGWKNSPGHYENMVRPTFNRIGLGMCNISEYGNGPYWTQLFSD